MRSLIYFLSFFFGFFLLVGCNSDDDEQDQASCETFLECNANSLWKIVEVIDGKSYETYIRINEDLNNPLEFWTHPFPDNDCYYHLRMSDAMNMFQIREHTRSRFTIRIEEMENRAVQFTMSTQGDVMTVRMDYYEGQEIIETEQVQFNRSSANVNALPLCEADKTYSGIWKPRR